MTVISALAALISALTGLALVVLAIKDHRRATIAVEELERRLRTLDEGHVPGGAPPDLSVPGWILKLISPAEAALRDVEWREHLWSRVESGEIHEALKDRRRLAAAGIAMALTGRIRRTRPQSVPRVRTTTESFYMRGFRIESRLDPLRTEHGHSLINHTVRVTNYNAVECAVHLELSCVSGLTIAGNTRWKNGEVELSGLRGTRPSFTARQVLSAPNGIQAGSAIEINVYTRRRSQREARLIGVFGHVISTASDGTTVPADS